MEYFCNGIIVYDVNQVNGFIERYIPHAQYNGVHKFRAFPFSSTDKDPECRELHKRQFSKQVGEDAFETMYFITEIGLLKDYLKKMRSLNMSYRLLYLESSYQDELCEFTISNKNFLGFEVCEIPFDPWSILDLFAREQFKKHRDKLNIYGLFSAEEEAAAFANDYCEQMACGVVGDGAVDLYVCRVYEANDESFL